MALTIYPECNILPIIDNNCWRCTDVDLCSSLKVVGCTNNEKDKVIEEMTSPKKKRSEETYEVNTSNC